ncbi:MacB family efflux pump subunit [Rhodospirillum centenum]|uniref:Pyoverdine export ATP-binding/permease protein PvdT n=1 Tax=Rhodospirillum centenum (strain ATCC 51521 / SW) TaxID=414684 RepID=B6IUJ7_RHOCS|nr:MacB family efflux pump subunit [Rhodospirillum centenum]ACI99822.1 macrolide-specific ABC-type efflux carrier [Rhodospirillum centenum SW]
MAGPLIELRGLRREFPSGSQTLTVLKDVDLTINAGEMVAIVGASGSGKSTLLNILGCLDRPTAGSYRIMGKETSALEPDELAQLRREHFGFIFQRYHLLPDLTAVGNVEVPAVYAGTPRAARRERVLALLDRLGMSDRTDHRPGQLSGGQQQRVSIARALVNGGEVVLADEPTGALDRQSGAEVLRILEELHADGHTVIIVTHDMGVAEHAQRIIEISDGEIVADRPGRGAGLAAGKALEHGGGVQASALGAAMDRFAEAFRMAVLAMGAHKLRTFLTMLGIIIGIASVVSVVALGEGSRQRILQEISAIGTNTLDIMPGRGFGDRNAGRINTLVIADADALAAQPYVDSVTPMVSSSVVLRYGNVASNGQVRGVGAQYFRVRGTQAAAGSFFGEEAVRGLTQDVVIDENTRNTLFTDPAIDPIGQVILVGSLPARVIGVAQKQASGFGGGGDTLTVHLPYTTVMHRILGSNTLRSITVRVGDDTPMDVAEKEVTRFLTQRHGSTDFFIVNTDEIRATITNTTAVLTMLIASIAVISLVVGGIGVMNIMLVSVTERTREIGVRMAVGARQSDILQQFLIEAVLVCLIGGVAGILLALGIGAGFSAFGAGARLVFSPWSIVLAFACSTLIGVVFGFLPARSAARLDPVEALVRE